MAIKTGCPTAGASTLVMTISNAEYCIIFFISDRASNGNNNLHSALLSLLSLSVY